MNLKPILQYHRRNFIKVFSIMYGCVYLIMLTEVFLQHQTIPDRTSTSGLEIATAITAFIMALNSFKEPFRFFVSNGFSRKSLFQGTILSFGACSAVIALLDCVSIVIFSLFMDYVPLYSFLTGNAASNAAKTSVLFTHPMYSFPFLLKNLLWYFCCFFAFAMLGLLITILYYQMNKTVKILVSAGIPVLLFIGLPTLDKYMGNGIISYAINQIFTWWLTLSAQPLTDLISRMALAAVFIALSFLFMRRAPVKDR